jgi:hypothetical protein
MHQVRYFLFLQWFPKKSSDQIYYFILHDTSSLSLTPAVAHHICVRKKNSSWSWSHQARGNPNSESMHRYVGGIWTMKKGSFTRTSKNLLDEVRYESQVTFYNEWFLPTHVKSYPAIVEHERCFADLSFWGEKTIFLALRCPEGLIREPLWKGCVQHVHAYMHTYKQILKTSALRQLFEKSRRNFYSKYILNSVLLLLNLKWSVPSGHDN